MEEIQVAILELPEAWRAALTLVCIQGIKPSEAARILECSLPTLYWRIHQSRKRLGQKIVEVSMTPQDPSKQVDKLLQKWAEEHQPTQDHLDGLIDRVQQSLRANPVVPNTNHPAEFRNARATTNRRATLILLGMAASVLIGWVGWQGAFHLAGQRNASPAFPGRSRRNLTRHRSSSKRPRTLR